VNRCLTRHSPWSQGHVREGQAPRARPPLYLGVLLLLVRRGAGGYLSSPGAEGQRGPHPSLSLCILVGLLARAPMGADGGRPPRLVLIFHHGEQVMTMVCGRNHGRGLGKRCGRGLGSTGGRRLGEVAGGASREAEPRTAIGGVWGLG
jgi:hypothetical protein